MIPEIVTQLPALLPPSSICKTPTTILLSVGGGGLLAGVLTGLVSYNLKDTGVITVETAGADCFAESLRLNGRQGWKMGDKVQVVEMEAITSRAGSLGAKSPAKGIKAQPAGCTVTNDDEGEEGPALFGVFDGHGGSSAAKFAGTTMHTRLRGLESYRKLNIQILRRNKLIK